MPREKKRHGNRYKTVESIRSMEKIGGRVMALKEWWIKILKVEGVRQVFFVCIVPISSDIWQKLW